MAEQVFVGFKKIRGVEDIQRNFDASADIKKPNVFWTDLPHSLRSCVGRQKKLRF